MLLKEAPGICCWLQVSSYFEQNRFCNMTLSSVFDTLSFVHPFLLYNWKQGCRDARKFQNDNNTANPYLGALKLCKILPLNVLFLIIHYDLLRGGGYYANFLRFRFLIFPNVSSLSKHILPFEYHVHIWQVSPQLSCGDTRQMWKWFKETNR